MSQRPWISWCAWGVLIIAVAGGLGWFKGRMSTRPSAWVQVAAEPSRPGAPNGEPGDGIPVPPSPEEHPGPAGQATPGPESWASGSEPAEPAMPKDKPRTEYSTWTTMASALAESERNGKPILIDFNADWCPPCQKMKSEVFDNGVRGQAVQTAVIPVSIVDRIRENGHNPPEIENLQNRFGVNAFPTLVVFSPATGRMVRTQGFGGADQTVQWITEAAQFVR